MIITVAPGRAAIAPSLAHVAITGNHGNLAGNHDVGGAFDAVNQRFAAAVQVVEFGFGHRIVDVDCRERQQTVLAI